MRIVNIFYLSIFACFIFFGTKARAQHYEFYNQNVYQSDIGNVIYQTYLKYYLDTDNAGFYVGIEDFRDQLTRPNLIYTDSQTSPLIGYRTNVFFDSWLPTRFYMEAWYVHRTISFNDRSRDDYELRPSLIGYNKQLKGQLFFEEYHDLFFSRLYQNRFIFQGWLRGGEQLSKSFDVFAELNINSFDLSNQNQFVTDLRPGVRYQTMMGKVGLQLLEQWVYHTNIQPETESKTEWFTTLVFFSQF